MMSRMMVLRRMEGDDDVEMAMLRRRKMMILRMLMWRRRTDPKTGQHVLCGPARSKCTWTFHKSHVMWKFTGKRPQGETGTHTLHEPAQSMSTCRSQKSHFNYTEIYTDGQSRRTFFFKKIAFHT